MKKLRACLRRDMLRPILYQVSARIAYAAVVVLLWNRFLNSGGIAPDWGFLAVMLFYLLMAWFAYLRLDGVGAPKFDRRLFLRRRRENTFGEADMADYIDHKPVSFEELEDEEKDACLLLSNLITAVLFLIIGIIFG